MLAGTQIEAGVGFATVLADMDFETYSEADLLDVGAAKYAEHPSTEVLSLSYDLKDGTGKKLWVPGLPDPYALFGHIEAGLLIEAHNSLFEYYIWQKICCKKLGWPPLTLRRLRCSQAKARAYSLPGKLATLADVLQTPIRKDKDGDRLIKKFSMPRKPTKDDARTRILPSEDPEDAQRLYNYNITDIAAESAVSQRCPDLSPEELELWLIDQEINTRGVYVDKGALDNCAVIVDAAFEKYTKELQELTGGEVETVGQGARYIKWCAKNGLDLPNFKKETVEEAVEMYDALDKCPAGSPILPHLAPYAASKVCHRPLEIRQIIGSAAVKKLYAASRQLCDDQRLRGMFAYYKAHTGRFTGCGPQPQNLPNSGLDIYHCACGAYHCNEWACPSCSADPPAKKEEWSNEAVDYALTVIASRSLDTVETYFGDAVAAVSGCLRGLFIAAPGHGLICSDFSAIEAVVLAFIAGEEWRMEVFRTHGKIYEMAASKISGIPFEEFLRYKEETGSHHPLRKKLGKVGELAGGFGGGLNAWKNFGAGKYFTDEEIEVKKKEWREASPMIVKFWYAVEDAARKAIQHPGQVFGYRGFKFGMKGDVLFLRLLSGRYLKYHAPRLHPDVTPWGKPVLKITHMGIHPESGKWVRKDTYGGRITENITQAVARDIFTHSMVNLTHAGYPIVLHTHDEITSEIPHDFGSIEEFEKIMATPPAWCADWPIRAAGGWRGKRYRKD